MTLSLTKVADKGVELQRARQFKVDTIYVEFLSFGGDVVRAFYFLVNIQQSEIIKDKGLVKECDI